MAASIAQPHAMNMPAENQQTNESADVLPPMPGVFVWTGVSQYNSREEILEELRCHKTARNSKSNRQRKAKRVQTDPLDLSALLEQNQQVTAMMPADPANNQPAGPLQPSWHTPASVLAAPQATGPLYLEDPAYEDPDRYRVRSVEEDGRPEKVPVPAPAAAVSNGPSQEEVTVPAPEAVVSNGPSQEEAEQSKKDESWLLLEKTIADYNAWHDAQPKSPLPPPSPPRCWIQ